MKPLIRSQPVQTILPVLLGGYLACALRTTRWVLEGADNLAPFAMGKPVIVAFWHEFLPFLPILPQLASSLPEYRPVPIHALVSQHRDGRIIGSIVSRFGINPILGSSSKGGASALRSLIEAVRQGNIVSITPDGPRGPKRTAAAGVAQLSAIAGVPILPCAARTKRSLLINTWDSMSIPIPYGTGVMVCGPALNVPRYGWREALPSITRALNNVADRAAMLCSS
jgi:lysophospholipid acyltransferase (LPLAT)-like uncharacterized protein